MRTALCQGHRVRGSHDLACPSPGPPQPPLYERGDPSAGSAHSKGWVILVLQKPQQNHRDHRELSGHPQPVVVPLPQQSIELELLCFQQRHLLLCATPFCADLPLGNSFCGDSPSGFLAAAQCSPDSPACAPEHQWGLGSPPWYPSILTGLTWLLDRLWGKISQF